MIWPPDSVSPTPPGPFPLTSSGTYHPYRSGVREVQKCGMGGYGHSMAGVVLRQLVLLLLMELIELPQLLHDELHLLLIVPGAPEQPRAAQQHHLCELSSSE